MARGRSARAGFTLVELLVVIGIIAVLVSILLPALSRARGQALKINCRAKLRGLIQAVHLYADTYKGYLPGPYGICDPPGPETTPTTTGWLSRANLIKDPRIWLCPSDPRLGRTLQYSYTYNGRMIVRPGLDSQANPAIVDPPHMRKLISFKQPTRAIVFAEENTMMVRPYPINDAYFIYYDVTDARHLGMSEVGYLDGHAGEIPPNIALWSNKEYWPYR